MGDVTVEARRSDCPVACTLEILGDKWTLLIVRDLFFADGPLRFGDLLAAAESIPTSTLTDRLRRLENAGLVERELYQERPPRSQYRLTDAGRDLGPVLRGMSEWGLRHIEGTVR